MLGLGGIRNLLNNTVKRFSRKVPQSMEPVFVPLDLNSLNVTLGSIIDNDRPVTLGGTPREPDRFPLKDFHTKIVTFVTKTYPNKIVLSGDDIFVNGKKGLPLDVILGKHTPAVVYKNSASNTNIQGILFNKFNAAQADFFDGFLNKEVLSYLNKKLGSTLTSFDAGIIMSNPSAPLAKKVTALSRILNSFSKSTVKVEGVNAGANKARVFQTQAVVDSLLRVYSRTNEPGIQVHAKVKENLSGFLASIQADIIIIQDSGTTENIAARMGSGPEVRKIAEMLTKTTVTGKRSFLQKIGDNIGAVFLGKKTQISTGAASMQSIDTRKETPISVGTTPGKSSTFTFPQGSMSPAALLAILNAKLTQTVISNMGTGKLPNPLLINREGTLAKSFKVENVAITRQGAITAFYSYDRGVYGTFAEGGLQQNPRTRDPTRLADKSIRAIAAKNAVTALRTQVI